MNFSINDRAINNKTPTYIIAELSCNHNGNFDEAIRIIEAAAEAGANCIKLQTYTPETISRDFGEQNACIKGTDWDGYSTFDLYKAAYTPWEWHTKLAERADYFGMDIFSSPFDESAVDFLVEQKVPALKVASFEVVDIKLLEKMAKTGLPVIMSNGMTTPSELCKAVQILRSNGCKNISILHCNSGYPALFEDANLKTIPAISDIFADENGPVTVGLSDHTLWADPENRNKPMGHITPTEAVRFGARIVEIHLIMNRAEGKALMKEKKGGFDWAFSREPDELKRMIDCIRKVECDPEWQYDSEEERQIARLTHGKVWMWPTEKEKPSRKIRPSLYSTAYIHAGEKLIFQGGNNNAGNFDSIRPNDGLPIEYTDIINGAYALCDIKPGEPIQWKHILKK